MDKIEELLYEEKRIIDEINVPEELEMILTNSLEKASKKKNRGLQKSIAVCIIVLLFFSFNIETLAFYGKKLVGYDNVMSGTLQELNELGKGQVVEESFSFSDGVTVTLDGVMLDDNSLILYYSIDDPRGNIQNVSERMNIYLMFGKSLPSYRGIGEFDEEGNYLRFVLQTNDPPSFFDNTVKLNLNYNIEGNKSEYGEISFKLDRKQAVGKSIRVPINKNISIDKKSIRVKSLTASPTSTVIKGQIQNILELGLDYIKKERIYPEDIQLALYANGKEIELQGAGMTTNLNGINYDLVFDRLPENTKEVQLELRSFEGIYDVDQKIDLGDVDNKIVEIKGQDININSVKKDGDYTYILITTEETTTLPKLNLNINGENKELLETIPEGYEKREINGEEKTYYSRTLKFLGNGDNMNLHVQRIRYTKIFNQIVLDYKLK
ncbi:DUF4179 domain-containing protein [Alkalibaculum sp. M08DMB]|uniref:DUF4179 domain-containing protein n=1 Tax=Alkalibaculum sporogenes TaxID=2655001 RepID=A0A6A7KBG6_9FIRM|nr:DUF4179 domain-containing protein [Alkalibaculum sporogenes]MPW26746.1 DUF4179 domain-containing protein [Alkalibaculum sporogenes]